jgi:hypothetical protein
MWSTAPFTGHRRVVVKRVFVMTGLIAAMKRDPARHLAQNLLAPFNGSSQPLELPADDTPFEWSTGLEIVLNLTPPPGQPYSVDILPDGKISAFFQADIYVNYIEFDFDVNRVWGSGLLQVICLKKVPILGCIAWLPVIMPPVGSIRFRINLPRIPLGSFNPAFAVDNLETTDRIDDDHLQLSAKLSILTVGVFTNAAGFAEMVVNALADAVRRTLGGIPGLGLVIRYVTGFIEKIVDYILNAVKFVETLENYILSTVQRAVADLLGRFFGDPTINIKVTKVPGRVMLAPMVTGSAGQTQPALYANFDSIVFDVNKDCPAGPELRLTVTVS